MLKAYKYRLYPTKEQGHQLNKNMGCVRFVYNWGLGIMKEDDAAYKYFIETFANPFLLKYDIRSKFPRLSVSIRLKITLHLLKNIFKTNSQHEIIYKGIDEENRHGGLVFIKGARLISFYMENDSDSILQLFKDAVELCDENIGKDQELINTIWAPTRYNFYDLSKELPILKKQEQYKWLKEAGSITLIFAIRNLETAFKNFFDRIKAGKPGVDYGYPKFKQRWHRQSMQMHQGYTIDFEKEVISIPKMTPIKFNPHRLFNSKIINQVLNKFDTTLWFSKLSDIEKIKITLYFIDRIYGHNKDYQSTKERCLGLLLTEDKKEFTKQENNILSWILSNYQANDIVEFNNEINQTLLSSGMTYGLTWKTILGLKQVNRNTEWVSEVSKVPLDLATFGTSKTVTIKRVPSGRYYISILLESVTSDPEVQPTTLETSKILGVDHGIRHFLTTSDGKQWDRFRVDNKLVKRLRLEQRRLSRKKLHSNSREKQRTKKARLDERIADKRLGFIEKVALELLYYCKENGYDTLVFRKYEIQKMMKKPDPIKSSQRKTKKGVDVFEKNGRNLKRQLNKKISNVAWGTFIEKIKSHSSKVNVAVYDSVSPIDTSRKCNHCGHVSQENIKGPIFHCQACGSEKDVDFNSALNTRDDFKSLSLEKVV